ncbi:HNH endonuclease signature motif containing protein, partial [Tsukamurella spumae]
MNENTCTASDYFAILTAFKNAAEALASASPGLLSSQEVLDGLHSLESACRKLPYVQHVLAEAAVAVHLPDELGYTGLKELLVDQLRLSGTEARDRVRGAADRVPRTERGFGETARFERVAQAQREGIISERHATAIEAIFQRCRKTLPDSDFDFLESVLVTAAESMPPEDLAVIGRRVISHIDPDGSEPKENVRARARGVEVGRQDEDLMSPLSGDLSPEGRALFDVIVERFARPGVNNPADSDEPVDPSDQDAVATAAKRDTRSAAQRNHDALVMALKIAVAAGESGAGLGLHRGVPCVPIITMTLDQLESGIGVATTATGGRVPVADAIAMFGTTNPKYVLLLGLDSRPLFLGREKRLASADQRLALYGSDTGCTAPGCDLPATRCQVHHIVEWTDGGMTDITELALVCDKHHGLVRPKGESHRPGCETIAIPPGEPFAGRTGWRRTADRSGAFRVNHKHHPEELHREAIRRWRERTEQFRHRWQRQWQRAAFDDYVGTIYSGSSKLSGQTCLAVELLDAGP